MHKDSWNVATSQRRDVPTSRCPNVAMSPRRDVSTSRRWVNIYRSQQAATSRRLNIVTSQRRDVTTSRRQRELCLSIIKSKRGPEFKGGSKIEDVGTRAHGNHHSSRTLTLEKSHHFVSSSFRTKRLMFYRLTICAFSFSMF